MNTTTTRNRASTSMSCPASRFRIDGQVRVEIRLAQLHQAYRPRARERGAGQFSRHGPDEFDRSMATAISATCSPTVQPTVADCGIASTRPPFASSRAMRWKPRATASISIRWRRRNMHQRAVLAGGCFWGMQDPVRKQPGIVSTRVGYTGGDDPERHLSQSRHSR